MSTSKILKLALLILSSLLITDLLAIFFFFSISAAIQRTWVAALCTLLDVFFLAALVHGQTWREGLRDKNRVKYGHMEKKLHKGLVAGLVASVPGLILYILLVVTAQSTAANGFYLTYLLFNATYFQFVVSLRFYPVILALFLLPIPLFSTIGYIQGYREIYIFRNLVYKKDKKEG